MKEFTTKTGLTLPLIDLKGKDYLLVAHRVQWFRAEKPDWGIETDVRIEGKSCLATAWIKDPSGRTIAMAHKVEDSTGFPDFVEKSSTGAIGRALALCGYGTQFASELDEGSRIVDSPMSRVTAPTATSAPIAATSTAAISNPGTVLVPFGKYKDQPIFQLPIDEVQASITYWEGRAIAEGKPLSGKVASYIAACKAFLAQKIGPGAVPHAARVAAVLEKMPAPMDEDMPAFHAETDDAPF